MLMIFFNIKVWDLQSETETKILKIICLQFSGEINGRKKVERVVLRFIQSEKDNVCGKCVEKNSFCSHKAGDLHIFYFIFIC